MKNEPTPPAIDAQDVDAAAADNAAGDAEGAVGGHVAGDEDEPLHDFDVSAVSTV